MTSLEIKNLSGGIKQRGIALPMILILLLVMTLLGVASLNTTVLEDQMSGNTRTREIAFNAAETTLRFGELRAEQLKGQFRGGNLPGSSGSVQLFSGNTGTGGNLWPPDSPTTQPGDTCDGGFCIPAQFDLSGNLIGFERWEDPSLDVWDLGANNNRHLVYADYTDSDMDNEGVFEAPKYIIEYMGDFPEEDPLGGAASYAGCEIGLPGYNTRTTDYPFCSGAPSFFRITARAVAGSPGRETVVVLQSTVRVP